MTMDNQSLLLRSALRHTREEDAITVAERTGKARILVVGTGGGGNNTVNRIMTVGINGAECIAMNTDKKHLDAVKANQKILLGPNQTRGLGAGGFPEIGETAAEESIDEIRTALEGADLIFIAVGLGGGTGTGSAPVIARVAREEIGAIVVGTATMPFTVERARAEKAHSGLEKLRQHCDTVVAINNDKLLDLVPNIPVKEAFGTADEILASMVKGITETISTTSLINLDFADVRAVLRGGGVAMVGLGEAQGEVGGDRVEAAVHNALDCPLLSLSVNGATGALIHVTGGPNMTIQEATDVARIVTDKMDPNANIIWGSRIDADFNDWLRVILVVTGVDHPNILGPTEFMPNSGFRSVDTVQLDPGFVQVLRGASKTNPCLDLGITKRI